MASVIPRRRSRELEAYRVHVSDLPMFVFLTDPTYSVQGDTVQGDLKQDGGESLFGLSGRAV
jgi:hypothetical protein